MSGVAKLGLTALLFGAVSLPAQAQGWTAAVGAVQTSRSSQDGWPSGSYNRGLIMISREAAMGVSGPVMGFTFGLLSSSSKEVRHTGGGRTFSQGQEGMVGLHLASPGRIRIGGGVELRLGSSKIRYTGGGGDSSGESHDLGSVKNSVWAVGAVEARVAPGWWVFARCGLGTGDNPVPNREYSLGLRYRP